MCNTLRKNRPDWNVVEGDISKIDFTEFRDQIDILSGGFLAKPFRTRVSSWASKIHAILLFYNLLVLLKKLIRKFYLVKNVRGCLAMTTVKPLDTISKIIQDLGYTLVEPRVLKAMFCKSTKASVCFCLASEMI